MQCKYQKPKIANFGYFELYCGILIVSVVFFYEVVVQDSCCAEML